MKSDLLVQKVLKGEPPRLLAADMVKVIKQPWEDAFHPDISRKGWKEIGFDPATKGCNRKLYWDLKKSEESAQEKLDRSNASEVVLDTSCLQFQQNARIESHSDPSDSSDSGNSRL